MSPMFWERSLMYKCTYNIRISDIMVCFSDNKTVLITQINFTMA